MLQKKPFLMFALMWTAYTSCYLLRKPFGIIKTDIQSSMNITESELGYIDLAFNLPYALVSLCFSCIGDVIGAKLTLGGGLIGSAVTAYLMGISYNFITLLVLLFGLGTFQAVTWPAACDILSTWFSKRALTSMMGLFGTSLLTGSVISAALTISVAERYDWHSVFYIPSGIVLVIGIVVLLFANKKAERETTPLQLESKISTSDDDVSKTMSFVKILMLPIIPHVSLTLFCIKGIRNAMLFWLPYYLIHVFNYSTSEAGYLSLIFEIGGLASVPLTIFIDKCMNRNDLLAITVFNFLLGLSNAVLLFKYYFGNVLLFTSLFISGALSSSSEITLCGSVATKLGTKFGARVAIVGVVNGIGSLGSVVEGPVVSYLLYWYGVESLIPFIVVFSAIGTIISIHALFIQKRINKLESDRKLDDCDNVIEVTKL